MTIRIAARLRPFSHLPGTVCLLPRTHLKVQIFPARVDFSLFSLNWDIQGPVKDFTVELDLELQQIVVCGKTKQGYMRYRLQAQADGIAIILDKIPSHTLGCHVSQVNQTHSLSRGETLLIPHNFAEQQFTRERLSLGMHKAQDWQLIKRRLDLKEIFPIWMRLGQMTPPALLSSSTKGNLSLLSACAAVVEEERKSEVISAFTELFLAAFDGICVPRLVDTDYQGLSPFAAIEAGDPSPLPILNYGAFLIRSLFFKETSDTLALLPCLPADFHAGRMLEMHTLQKDQIDFEWSKKQLRTLCIRPCSERQLRLKLSRQLSSCRVRSSSKEGGKEHPITNGILSLDISPGVPFLIDRFQK